MKDEKLSNLYRFLGETKGKLNAMIPGHDKIAKDKSLRRKALKNKMK